MPPISRYETHHPDRHKTFLPKKRGGVHVERQAMSKRMDERRQPLLIDRFFNENCQVFIRRDIEDKVRQRTRFAHRFVLDNNAIDRFAQVVRDIPELIAQHQHFARAPFEVTWVEFDIRRFWAQVNIEAPNEEKNKEDADTRVGYLIDGNRVYTVCEGGDKLVGLCPVIFDLHQPTPLDQQMTIARQIGLIDYFKEKWPQVGASDPFVDTDSLIAIDLMFWGSTFNTLQDHLRRPRAAIYSSLRNQHGFSFLPHLNPKHNTAKLWAAVFNEQASDLRNIIAFLLLLNRPSLTRYKEEVPRWRSFVKGKMRPFFEHNVITIDIDPIPTLRLLGTKLGEATPKRRHEVRGTWCHNRTAREYGRIVGCVHEWERDEHYIDDDPNDPDHYLCRVCEGKRWWRAEHERGDASIGWVRKEYEVTNTTPGINRRRRDKHDDA